MPNISGCANIKESMHLEVLNTYLIGAKVERKHSKQKDKKYSRLAFN